MSKVHKPKQLKSDFAAMWDVHPDFLSTPHKDYTMWEVFRQLDGYFDSLGRYQQTFQTKELPGELTGSNEYVEASLWACGSFPVKSGQKSTLWANPQYAHPQSSIRRRDAREFHIEKAIEYPTVKAETLAERFGISPSGFGSYLYRNDVDFRERRQREKQRVGRSMRCTAKWTDYGIMQLAELMPVPTETAKTWAVENAVADGWYAPDPPEGAKWYRE